MEPLTPQSSQPIEDPKSPQNQMEIHLPPMIEDSSSTPWDWNDLLDFNFDDQFAVHFEEPEADVIAQIPIENPVPDRVRKRDPRMSCSNFLAGRVPCACPELDAQLLAEAEEEGRDAKKKSRVSRAGSKLIQCQVPECEVDISELKGYHKRHKICLRCATASCVLLDGQNKRYCQQCGKFHMLSDFDEGRRSCRRKLERHNDRRRRNPSMSRCAVGKKQNVETENNDVICDGEIAKVGSCSDVMETEKEASFESEDGHVSSFNSMPNLENVNRDNVVSVVVSGEAQPGGRKGDPKVSDSPSYCDTKNAYTSMCPTGRISFKLYDWNPAEFPRRLRQQILQWLANMPVELEGYIRPGCTILTVFVAMPNFMWAKLFKDPTSYIRDFIAPGMMLSGKGSIIVHLNNMIFHVMREMDGMSVMKGNIKAHAPRLHQVHPTCFEAGKPMEFVACGSNLLQSKFRFLVSFGGNYIPNDYSIDYMHGQTEGDTPYHFGHQLYKIRIPLTQTNHFGPAFIEVENESGLSNFIPVLIGDKETCLELETIQKRFDTSLVSRGPQCSCSVSESTKDPATRRSAFSEIVLDIAWLLKKPSSENLHHNARPQIQRFNHLLNFLICNESTVILEKVLENLKIVMENKDLNNESPSDDMMQLQKHMDCAREFLYRKLHKDDSVLRSENDVQKLDYSGCCSESTTVSIVSIDQELEVRATKMVLTESTSRNEPTSGDFVVDMNHKTQLLWPKKSYSANFPKRFFSYRPAVFIMVTAALCLGACAVIFHPAKVSNFALSIRRCLFDGL